MGFMHIKEFNILLCESDAEGEGLMALDMVKALFLLLYFCLFTYSPALVAPLLGICPASGHQWV